MDHTLMRSRLVTIPCLLASLLMPLGAQGQDERVHAGGNQVTEIDREYLLQLLDTISPPERIRELAEFSRTQLDLGGGFYGMLPDQLADPDSIPIPADETGRQEAILSLSGQRRINLEALEELNPDYVLRFDGHSLEEFLGRMPTVDQAEAKDRVSMRLTLDVSAIQGFFDALDDGEITAAEASALAALPSNQAMLQHRRNLGYVPDPLPDTESLAAMIRQAGSADPLDRIWCWLSCQNAFDYADLVQNADDYGNFLADLDDHGGALVDAALERIAAFCPPGTRFEATFAMTVGWAIRGWVTPDMAGLNIEQTKDDWHFLFGTMVEETYHRLQLDLFPTPSGAPAREFSDLVAIETGDERYDRLYEILTYTVAEGAANRVRGPFAAPDLADKIQPGTDLMDRFVREVVIQGNLESADAFINEGLKGNGPLYGLGWKLAGLIAEQDGGQAVGEFQQEGPVRFVLYGNSIAADRGKPLFGPEVVVAVEELARRLDR